MIQYGVQLTELVAQAPPPGPDPEPYQSYLLAVVGVLLFYAGTRVDTDSSHGHRRLVARGFFLLGGVVVVLALAAGALGAP